MLDQGAATVGLSGRHAEERPRLVAVVLDGPLLAVAILVLGDDPERALVPLDDVFVVGPDHRGPEPGQQPGRGRQRQ